ncbi:YezD family protein [Novosphingobium resinovorum]|uniref:YezD family protein n=1 Tax=Novosphingobium resinovorum TaxID=158500 RepID=UPI002ED527BF|nr:YezD family protein [Novosphingobium resinovorum]
MRIAKPADAAAVEHPLLNEGVQHVIEALQRLRFGVIQLTVHDGKLMQVDVTERRRFNH